MDRLAQALRWLAWVTDTALDHLPAYEDGRWYRYGDWGCRLRLHRVWWPGEEPLEGRKRA